jgi:hypothetical protein
VPVDRLLPIRMKNKLLSLFLVFAVICPPSMEGRRWIPRIAVAGGGITAPTFISATASSFTDTALTETTASVSWNSGDVVLVLGVTEDSGRTFSTPTATGLTFALVDSQSVANDCGLYLWSATAGSTSSAAVSASTNGGSQYSGIVVQVWRGCGGLGTPVKAAGANTQTISLTRVSANSCVAFISGDWNAISASGASASPSGTVDTSGGNASYGYVVTHYGSQGATGTTSYGVSGWTGTLDAAKIAVEVKGL